MGKMNPEIKKRWVEALRSGEYKQGKEYLHTVDENGKDKYCCLGVLACIAREEGTEIVESSEWEFCDSPKLPSEKLMKEWCGIGRNELVTGTLGQGKSEYYLWELNDLGASFKKIAKYIEEQL